MSGEALRERTDPRPACVEPLARVGILGVQVTATSMDLAVQRVCELSRMRNAGSAAYVCATSVHGVVEAQRDPGFRRILNRADLIAADGMPLVWGARLRGRRDARRVYGPSLMKAVCRATAGTDVRHFFYGGAPGVADRLADRMSEEFPGLEVAGTYCPPFRPLTDEEMEDVTSVINGSRADIVWVGLSTPKQERWIDRVRKRLDVGVLISVGAAFDFHTDRVATAPPWMQRIGLEWFFRLTQEPRRLWRRYLVNNPTFLFLALLEATGLRSFDEAPVGEDLAD